MRDDTTPAQKLLLAAVIVALALALGFPLFHYAAGLMLALLWRAHRRKGTL